MSVLREIMLTSYSFTSQVGSLSEISNHQDYPWASLPHPTHVARASNTSEICNREVKTWNSVVVVFLSSTRGVTQPLPHLEQRPDVCTYIYMYVCMHVCMNINALFCTCMNACMVRIYVYACMHVFMYMRA